MSSPSGEFIRKRNFRFGEMKVAIARLGGAQGGGCCTGFAALAREREGMARGGRISCGAGGAEKVRLERCIFSLGWFLCFATLVSRRPSRTRRSGLRRPLICLNTCTALGACNPILFILRVKFQQNVHRGNSKHLRVVHVHRDLGSLQAQPARGLSQLGFHIVEPNSNSYCPGDHLIRCSPGSCHENRRKEVEG